MDLKKQILYLEYLISSGEVLSKCAQMIQPKYFDPELRSLVKFVKQYYETYDTCPDIDLIVAETGLEFQKVDVSKDKEAHCVAELAEHCRNRAIEQFAIQTATAVNNGKPFDMEAALQEALAVGIAPEIGTDYYEDPYDRLSKTEEELDYFSTGFPTLDQFLGGGVARTTLTLFTGNSGTGKSVMLLNVARNIALQGKNVAFITLELSRRMTEERADQMITNANLDEIRSDKERYSEIITNEGKKAGRLTIQKMPQHGTSAADLKRYLKEYHTIYDEYPDALVIDYLDLCAPSTGITNDVFRDDKIMSEEIRQLGDVSAYNLAVVSASQQNRDGVGVIQTNHSHISGGISKINTSDNTISLVKNSTMKAEGKILLNLIKVRSGIGEGEQLYLKWPKDSLLITEENGTWNPQQTSSMKDEWEDDEFDEAKADSNLLTFIQ